MPTRIITTNVQDPKSQVPSIQSDYTVYQPKEDASSTLVSHPKISEVVMRIYEIPHHREDDESFTLTVSIEELKLLRSGLGHTIDSFTSDDDESDYGRKMYNLLDEFKPYAFRLLDVKL